MSDIFRTFWRTNAGLERHRGKFEKMKKENAYQLTVNHTLHCTTNESGLKKAVNKIVIRNSNIKYSIRRPTRSRQIVMKPTRIQTVSSRSRTFRIYPDSSHFRHHCLQRD